MGSVRLSTVANLLNKKQQSEMPLWIPDSIIILITQMEMHGQATADPTTTHVSNKSNHIIYILKHCHVGYIYVLCYMLFSINQRPHPTFHS